MGIGVAPLVPNIGETGATVAEAGVVMLNFPTVATLPPDTPGPLDVVSAGSVWAPGGCVPDVGTEEVVRVAVLTPVLPSEVEEGGKSVVVAAVLAVQLTAVVATVTPPVAETVLIGGAVLVAFLYACISFSSSFLARVHLLLYWPMMAKLPASPKHQKRVT